MSSSAPTTSTTGAHTGAAGAAVDRDETAVPPGKTDAKSGTTSVDTSGAGAVDLPVALPTIIVRDGPGAIAWYTRAMGTRTIFRYDDSSTGRVLHAVLATSYGLVFAVEDFFAPGGGIAPMAAERVGETPGPMSVYVTIPGKGAVEGETCDAVAERMRMEGAIVRQEPMDMFYGHRLAVIADVYGVMWSIAHEVERRDTTPAEE